MLAETFYAISLWIGIIGLGVIITWGILGGGD